MAESSSQPEHIEAVVVVRNLGINLKEERLTERPKSDGDSIYKVVRLRKSRSLNDVELQQFQPFTRNIQQAPPASLERRDNQYNLILEGHRDTLSQYEKRLYIIITILGVIIIILLSIVSYLSARRETEYSLIPISATDLPKNSTDNLLIKTNLN